jgi:hypothetical protein
VPWKLLRRWRLAREFLRRQAAAPCGPRRGAGPRRVGDGVQPTVQASAWLRAAGVPMAPVTLAADEDEAVPPGAPSPRRWR